jgi:protein-S-isoprenylcysteine O-methyltransferase Ste14
MTRVILFVCISAFLLYVSRHALRDVRSHGFYRFFAWEAIAAQILLAVPFWFRDPFSILQLCSWIVLLVALLYLADGGVRLLHHGKIDASRENATLFPFEKTTVVVSGGIYRYIRHPLYASLMFLCLGAFLKDPTWPGVVLTGSALGFLYTTAVVDERECEEYFGTAYRTYMEGTRRFVPFVW